MGLFVVGPSYVLLVRLSFCRLNCICFIIVDEFERIYAHAWSFIIWWMAQLLESVEFDRMSGNWRSCNDHTPQSRHHWLYHNSHNLSTHVKWTSGGVALLIGRLGDAIVVYDLLPIAYQTSRRWRHSAYHRYHKLIINSKWTVRSGMLTGQHDCCLRLVTQLQLLCTWLCNIASNENERYFVPIQMFNANTIHNYMQLETRVLLTQLGIKWLCA